MPFKFVRVSTQRVGLAQISDDPAILGVVDDRERLLCGPAEAIEGGAQVVSRQEKRDNLRNRSLHRLGSADAGRAHPRRIGHAAETAVVSTTNTCLMLPAGKRRRNSSNGNPEAITAGSRRIIGPTSRSLIQPTSSGLRIVSPRRWKRQVAKE